MNLCDGHFIALRSKAEELKIPLSELLLRMKK
jgi:hypothetical protein